MEGEVGSKLIEDGSFISYNTRCGILLFHTKPINITKKKD